MKNKSVIEHYQDDVCIIPAEIKSVPPEGVNSLSNLVPACHKCNRRKGSKCGFWLIRGKFWRICLPLYTILRIALVMAIIGCLYFVFFGYDSEFLKTLISLFV